MDVFGLYVVDVCRVPFIVPCLHSPKMVDVSHVGCEKENVEKRQNVCKRCFIILFAQRFNFLFFRFLHLCLYSLFMYVIQLSAIYIIIINK